jgi:acyl-CoA synthetase (AMP-forming)/AMP-acid ligase II
MTLAALLDGGPATPRGIEFAVGGFRSYPDLMADARAAAGGLGARGDVRPGDHVAICLENTRPSVTALLAVWMAGATVVSIPPVPRAAKASYYSSRLARPLRAIGCRVVIGSTRVQHALPGFLTLDPEGLGDAPIGRATGDAAIPDVALVQFTSGSTGDPRGVAISADALASHLLTIVARLELDPDRERGVSWLPLAHDMGLIGFLLTALAARADLVLETPGSFVRNPRSWLRMCAQERATITGAPDFALRQAVRGLDSSTVGDLSSLRTLLCGGERISESTLTRFAAVTAPAGFAPGALMPVYGMAEATLAVTMGRPGDGVRAHDGVVAVGPALPPGAVRIDHDNSEILIRSPWLCDGYWGATGFEPRPDEWLRTRDAGYVRDGHLHVVGRLDEARIVRGRNVYAEDVESLVVHDHDVVEGAAAWVDGDGFGTAVEVGRRFEGDAAELARCVARTARAAFGVQLSPVAVCRPLTIPRTTSGKPIRSECRRMTATAAWPQGRALVLANMSPEHGPE